LKVAWEFCIECSGKSRYFVKMPVYGNFGGTAEIALRPIMIGWRAFKFTGTNAPIFKINREN
jgi:hypothetical protein